MDTPEQEKRKQFAKVVQLHFENGSGRSALGLPRHGAWTDDELSQTISTKIANFTISDESIRQYRAGVTLPRSKKAFAVAAIFNGITDPDAAVLQNTDIITPWKQADAFRPRASSGRMNEDRHPNLTWKIYQDNRLLSVSYVAIDPPNQLNEPGVISFQPTILLNFLEADYEEHSVTIGLRKATLTFHSDDFQIVSGSTLPERREHCNLKRIPEGFEIGGPLESEGRLVGNVLGDEPIANLLALHEGSGKISINLVAIRKNFLVEVENDKSDTQVSANKRAILNALVYQDIKTDQFGRAVLSSVKLEKPEADDDDRQ